MEINGDPTLVLGQSHVIKNGREERRFHRRNPGMRVGTGTKRLPQ
jgi:hypothetical protein